ncbi:MAG TPA: phytase [Terricaulis sp.]|nr:phytase [Terricaulis sp.]
MRLMITAAALALLGACASYPTVTPVRETAIVHSVEDSADDPAIWVAADPLQSLVIGTQKKGGLYIYDLNGALVQEVPGGQPNNVDLRDGFAWAEGASPIVAASDRSDNSIAIWRLDPATRQLDATPRARIATGFVEVYGFCLGRMGEDFVAIATDRDSGDLGVWRIVAGADGALTGERIVTYSLGTISEGCVVDDETGDYYIAQEDSAIWRAALSDATGEGRRTIDRIGEGELHADIEGLGLWLAPNGGGYLVASIQGKNRFAVYDRGGDNAFRGVFRIGATADGAIDGVQGTDGLDVTSAPLGPDFPQGLLVLHDDPNTLPRDRENFKYVSWADVAAALGLD